MVLAHMAVLGRRGQHGFLVAILFEVHVTTPSTWGSETAGIFRNVNPTNIYVITILTARQRYVHQDMQFYVAAIYFACPPAKG